MTQKTLWSQLGCSPQRQTRAAAHFYVWWGKSLTALSFIFALQRYRPSPFYAFDEVDVVLEGQM